MSQVDPQRSFGVALIANFKFLLAWNPAPEPSVVRYAPDAMMDLHLEASWRPDRGAIFSEPLSTDPEGREPKHASPSSAESATIYDQSKALSMKSQLR